MKKNKKNLINSLFVLFLLSIGLVYAYLTSNLSITGSTEIAANSWDIHFANLIVNPNSVVATTPAEIDPEDTKAINYAVILNRPGDFYEFTVDIVNAGSLPGKIDLVTIEGITETAEDLIGYNVTYTTKNTPVSVNDIINGSSSKNIKVRVFYNNDIEINDLPDSNIPLTLTLNINFSQSNKDDIRTNDIVQLLKTNSSSCFTKYIGDVTDQVGVTTEANNVYFNKCEEQRNFIFGGFCWQMIRTTETEGIKLMYNGEVVDGKCESTRNNHKGVVTSAGSSQELNNEYLYSSSFSYDSTSGTFTLIDANLATWSDSTYDNIIGKYTCKNTTGTCSTLYNVNSYQTSTEAFITPHTIKSVNYANIGKSQYNSDSLSLSKVGYMFNKTYNPSIIYPEDTEIKYGNTFTYDENNNTYTLSGTIQTFNTWENASFSINNTHYTCWNNTGTCSSLAYIYKSKPYVAYYLELTNGKDISDLLEEMLNAEDVNKYNSTAKALLESWYKQNLNNFSSKIENNVYCNNREIAEINAFDPNGGSTYEDQALYFPTSSSLACPDIKDQFAVNNNKAKLEYSVGMLTFPEFDDYDYEYNDLLTNWNSYWFMSPSHYESAAAEVTYINEDGPSSYGCKDIIGIRPIISIKSDSRILGGDGSEIKPWIIE